MTPCARAAAAVLFSLPWVSAQQLIPLDINDSSGTEFAAGSRVRLLPIRALDYAYPCPLDPETVRAELYPLGQEQSLPVLVLPSRSTCLPEIVLPEDAAAGPSELRLTIEGGGGDGGVLTAFLRVVPFLPVVETDGGALPGSKLTRPATPGSTTTVRLTGTGAKVAAELRATLDGVPALVTGLRQTDSPGISELDLTVPSEPAIAGCYVVLAIASGARTSNRVTVPVMPRDGPCAHPFQLTAAQLQTLDDGGRVPLANVAIQRMFYSSESARLNFYSIEKTDMAVAAGSATGPPARECRLSTGYPVTSSINSFTLNTDSPGFELAGPQEKKLPLRVQWPTTFYEGLRDRNGPTWFTGGTWTLRGEATNVLQAAQWDFVLPPPWKPVFDLSRISSRIIEATWDGSVFSPGDTVSLQVTAADYVGCEVDATVGKLQMRLPDTLVLPANVSNSLRTYVSRHPSAPIIRPLNLANGRTGVAVIGYYLMTLPTER